jgi:hypothetical protein
MIKHLVRAILGAAIVTTLTLPAAAHSLAYDAIEAATIAYVHREHSKEFNPTITCIRVARDGSLAIVNYDAGPENDPVSTTLFLAQPSKLPSYTAYSLHVGPLVRGWGAVRATTTPIQGGGATVPESWMPAPMAKGAASTIDPQCIK